MNRLKKNSQFFNVLVNIFFVIIISGCCLIMDVHAEDYSQLQLDSMNMKKHSLSDSDYRTQWATYPVYPESEEIINFWYDPVLYTGLFDEKVEAKYVVIASKYYSNNPEGLLAPEKMYVSNSGASEEVEFPYPIYRRDDYGIGATKSLRVLACAKEYQSSWQTMINIKIELDQNDGQLTQELVEKYKNDKKYLNSYYVIEANQFPNVKNTNIKIKDYIALWENGDGNALANAAQSTYDSVQDSLSGISDMLEEGMQINGIDPEQFDALKEIQPLDYVKNVGIYDVEGMGIAKKETTTWYSLMKTIGTIGLVSSIMIAVLSYVLNPKKKAEILHFVQTKMVAAFLLFGTVGLFALMVSMIQSCITK